MSKPVVNLEEVEFSGTTQHGDRFDSRIAPVGVQIGARKLGYNVTVVPPGKRAFPFHNHHNNEELFFVLDGSGTLRFGQDEHPIRQGDFIACPPGGPEVAHQIINTGDEELRYLAVSTAIDIDVFQYPDSGRFGVVAGRKPGMRPQDAPFAGFYEEAQQVDYWDGE